MPTGKSSVMTTSLPPRSVAGLPSEPSFTLTVHFATHAPLSVLPSIALQSKLASQLMLPVLSTPGILSDLRVYEAVADFSTSPFLTVETLV